MPTATEFTALGAGNGFTSCLTEVEVSGYDYWTTLSGVNKNSPTTSDALIAESLQLGMKLFWNLNGFTGSGVRSDFADPFYAALTLDMYTGDYEESAWSKLGGGTDSDVNKEPKERVCYNSFDAGKRDPDLGGWLAIGLKVSIVRMYNSGEFVGYGVSSYCATVTTVFFDNLDLVSYADVGEFDDYAAAEYVDFDGMHFVAGLAPEEFDADDTYSIQVTGGNVVGGYTSTFPGFTATMTINPLNFYTY